MKDKKSTIIVSLLVILVVIIAGAAGIYLGGKTEKPVVVANGIVLNKEDRQYSNKLIKTYTEYNELLNEYNVLDAVVLTNNDFNEKDYIVDFIYYMKDLEIYNIDVVMEDDGLNLTYDVNMKIDDSDKYLMYFIPIDKGMLDNINIKNREFKLK